MATLSCLSGLGGLTPVYYAVLALTNSSLGNRGLRCWKYWSLSFDLNRSSCLNTLLEQRMMNLGQNVGIS